MLRRVALFVVFFMVFHPVPALGSPARASTAEASIGQLGPEEAEDDPPQALADEDSEATAVGKWSGYLHLTPKVGDDRQLGRFNLMYPLSQSWDSMFFADIRLTFDDNDATEGNVGVGFRRMVPGDDWIWGIYGFYDRLKSAHGNRFNQAAFGAELLKTNVELRGNVYLPDNKSHVIGYSAVSSVNLSGTTVIERTLSLEARERSLAGFDIEAGYGFDVGEKDQLWVHGGYFHFDDDDTPEVAGPRVRVQYEWNDAFGLDDSTFAFGVEVQHDDVRDTQTFATLNWSIPIGGRRPPRLDSSRWRQLESRMTRPIVRDVDVVTFGDDITKPPGSTEGPELISNHDVPLVDPLSDQEVDVYFVTATGGAAGTGTQDDPMTIVQAESTAGASDVIFLLNDDGDIDVSGASGGTLTLKPYQQLHGVGDGASKDVLLPNNHTLTVSTAAGRPTLARPAGSNVVRMIWANTIDGLTVSGGSSGIYGVNTSNPTIRDVAIGNTASNGIYLTNPSGTVSITDCVIQGNTLDAIDLRSTAGGTVSVALSDNDISSNGGYGVYLQNANAGVLTGAFEGNAIAANGYAGIYFSNSTGSTATVDVGDNQITGNGDQGLYVYNTGGSVATIDVGDNQITGNGDQGLYVYNTSSSVATIGVVDNSITSNGNEGVCLYNYTGSTLTAAVRDNLISDNADDNLYAYSNGGTMSVVLNNNDLIDSSADGGARLYNVGAGGVFSGDIADNRITGNANQGLYLYNTGDSYSATLRNNTITGNQAGGIDYFSDAGATTLTIENNTISNNSGGATVGDDIGLTIDQDTSATSTLALTLTNNLIENNGYTGVLLDNASGTFTASLAGNSITNNGLYGAYVVNQTTGVFTIDLYGNTLTENAGVGVWLVNNTGTLSALFESNIMAMNGGDGLELDNLNGGVFDYDLGGGGLGSAGLNSIFANGSGYDIDNDTATSILAQNNWWGATPPNPGRFSGAVDYAPYLVADPN